MRAVYVAGSSPGSAAQPVATSVAAAIPTRDRFVIRAPLDRPCKRYAPGAQALPKRANTRERQMSVRELWRLARQALGAWADDYAPSMGAALSYYTLFSI